MEDREIKLQEIRDDLSFLDRDGLTEMLANHVLALAAAEEGISSLRELLKNKEIVAKKITEIDLMREAIFDGYCSITDAVIVAARKKFKDASTRGTTAANALHNMVGGSREKQDAIRALWANGNFSSRSVCAEQECTGLGMSFDAARKALRNTPTPP